jgi:hypothetical protein
MEKAFVPHLMKKLLFLLIKSYCWITYKKFLVSLSHPQKSQRQVLKKILRLHGYQFSDLPSFYRDFPPQTWDMFLKKNNFTPKNKIIFFEKTTGSSGIQKNIPYSKDLLHSFSQTFKIWLYDLLQYGPKFKTGKFYFSLSPQLNDNEKTNQQDRQINNDSDYVQGPVKWIFTFFSVVPNKVKSLKNLDHFKMILSLSLLAERKLEIISIWSPSFFISLVRFIEANKVKIYEYLLKGEIELEKINFTFKPIKLNELKKNELTITKLFPSLKLISCWGSSTSSYFFQELKKLFPDVFIQAKGLLATEAPLTIPLIKAQNFLPMISEVYFEFLDNQGNFWQLHEIKLGHQYEILITQKSGLIRYKINDHVKVSGFYRNCPCLEFIGRGESYCDLVGEKLHENQIIDFLSNKDSFLILIPVITSSSAPHYIVIADGPIDLVCLENHFSKNIHYQYARKMNQLGPLQFYLQPHLKQKLYQYYYQHKNILLGNYKPNLIYKNELNGQLINFLTDYAHDFQLLPSVEKSNNSPGPSHPS